MLKTSKDWEMTLSGAPERARKMPLMDHPDERLHEGLLRQGRQVIGCSRRKGVPDVKT